MIYEGISYLARSHIASAIRYLDYAKKPWDKKVKLDNETKKAQDIYNMQRAIQEIENAIKEVENEDNNG